MRLYRRSSFSIYLTIVSFITFAITAAGVVPCDAHKISSYKNAVQMSEIIKVCRLSERIKVNYPAILSCMYCVKIFHGSPNSYRESHMRVLRIHLTIIYFNLEVYCVFT